MTPEVIIALISVGAQVFIEGGKIVATFKKDMTTDELIDALKKSKSASWPDFDFTSPVK